MANLTKGEIVNAAFSALGLDGNIGLTANDYETALLSLENLMSQWEEDGVYLNYNFSDFPRSFQRHEVDFIHWDTMTYNLAVQISSDFEIEPTKDMIQEANAAMSDTLSIVGRVQQTEINYPNRQPIGGANEFRTLRFFRYFPASQQPITPIGLNRQLFTNDVNFYFFDFSPDVNEDNISNFVINASPQLRILSTRFDNEQKRLEFALQPTDDALGVVSVEGEITNSNGEKFSKCIDFFVVKFSPSVNATISTTVAPVLPLDPLFFAGFAGGGSTIMADSRTQLVPDDSPFANITARDTWGATNFATLANSSTQVTTVYIRNENNSYTEYQWNGTDLPTSYDASNWIKVFELDRVSVRQLYESNYSIDNNNLGNKSNRDFTTPFGSYRVNNSNNGTAFQDGDISITPRNADTFDQDVEIQALNPEHRYLFLNTPVGASFRLSTGNSVREFIMKTTLTPTTRDNDVLEGGARLISSTGDFPAPTASPVTYNLDFDNKHSINQIRHYGNRSGASIVYGQNKTIGVEDIGSLIPVYTNNSVTFPVHTDLPGGFHVTIVNQYDEHINIISPVGSAIASFTLIPLPPGSAISVFRNTGLGNHYELATLNSGNGIFLSGVIGTWDLSIAGGSSARTAWGNGNSAVTLSGANGLGVDYAPSLGNIRVNGISGSNQTRLVRLTVSTTVTRTSAEDRNATLVITVGNNVAYTLPLNFGGAGANRTATAVGTSLYMVNTGSFIGLRIQRNNENLDNTMNLSIGATSINLREI